MPRLDGVLDRILLERRTEPKEAPAPARRTTSGAVIRGSELRAELVARGVLKPAASEVKDGPAKG